jgi:hypothetical protein
MWFIICILLFFIAPIGAMDCNSPLYTSDSEGTDPVYPILLNSSGQSDDASSSDIDVIAEFNSYLHRFYPDHKEYISKKGSEVCAKALVFYIFTTNLFGLRYAHEQRYRPWKKDVNLAPIHARCIQKFCRFFLKEQLKSYFLSGWHYKIEKTTLSLTHFFLLPTLRMQVVDDYPYLLTVYLVHNGASRPSLHSNDNENKKAIFNNFFTIVNLIKDKKVETSLLTQTCINHSLKRILKCKKKLKNMLNNKKSIAHKATVLDEVSVGNDAILKCLSQPLSNNNSLEVVYMIHGPIKKLDGSSFLQSFMTDGPI